MLVCPSCGAVPDPMLTLAAPPGGRRWVCRCRALSCLEDGRINRTVFHWRAAVDPGTELTVSLSSRDFLAEFPVVLRDAGVEGAVLMVWAYGEDVPWGDLGDLARTARVMRS